MFWIRSQCANEILSRVDFDQFETEGGQRDGTYGHVLERAIPMTLRANGWILRETNNEDTLQPCTTRDRKLVYFYHRFVAAELPRQAEEVSAEMPFPGVDCPLLGKSNASVVPA